MNDPAINAAHRNLETNPTRLPTRGPSSVLAWVGVLSWASIALAQSIPQPCNFSPFPSTADVSLVSTATPSNHSGQNGVSLTGFNLSRSCTTSGIAYSVTQLGPVNDRFDIGLVCQSGDCATGGNAGKLFAHLGALTAAQMASGCSAASPTAPCIVAQNWASTGSVCATFPCTLPAGIYGIAVGTDSTATPTLALGLVGDANAGAIYAFDVFNASTNVPWSFSASSGLPLQFASVPAIAPVTYTGGNLANPNAKPPNIFIF